MVWPRTTSVSVTPGSADRADCAVDQASISPAAIAIWSCRRAPEGGAERRVRPAEVIVSIMFPPLHLSLIGRTNRVGRLNCQLFRKKDLYRHAKEYEPSYWRCQ